MHTTHLETIHVLVPVTTTICGGVAGGWVGPEMN